jgi:uncharacterized alkaline shock family protein YloU
MIRFLNRLITILVVVILISSGLAMLAVIFIPEWKDYILSLMYPQTRMIFIATAIILICSGMLIMLTGKKKRKKERILSFKNDDGVIRISSAAISDYISKLITEFPSVVKMYPEVEPHGNMVDIIVTLRVKAGPQIHEICEVMQRRVRETMVNGLGISDVRHVIVHVNEISPEHKSD